MRWLRAAVVLACATLLASCAGDPASPERPDTPGGALQEALSLGPPGATGFYFTNWSELAEDPRDVLGSMQGDGTFFKRLDERGLFPMVSFESYLYPDFEKLWGWNTHEVEWEAAFGVREGPLVHVLRFRDSFDTSVVVPKLEERGYSASDLSGIAVYHHEETRDAPWFMDDFGPRTPIAVLNLAIVDDRTLLLSFEEEPLEATVTAAAEGTGTSGAIADAVAAVGDSPAVMAFPSDVLCSGPPLAGRGSERALASAERLEGHEYEGLAIGFAGVDEEPLATVALHYEDAADAEADLDLREAAASGWGIAADAPYREIWFTLERGATEGQDVVLEFSPSEMGTFGFQAALRTNDMTFAAC